MNRRNRVIMISAILLAAGLLPLAAGFGQEGKVKAPLKAGFVDLGRIYKKFRMTRVLAEDLRAWKIKRESDIVEKRAKLLEIRKQVASQKGMGSRNAHGQLVSGNKDLSKLSQGIHHEYARRLLENDQMVFGKIREAIEVVAKQEGMDLVLQTFGDKVASNSMREQTLNIRASVLLYGAPELDLTDLVLDELEDWEEGK